MKTIRPIIYVILLTSVFVFFQTSRAQVPIDIIENEINLTGLPTDFGVVISWEQLRTAFVNSGLNNVEDLIIAVLSMPNVILHQNSFGKWWIALNSPVCNPTFRYRDCRIFTTEDQ